MQPVLSLDDINTNKRRRRESGFKVSSQQELEEQPEPVLGPASLTQKSPLQQQSQFLQAEAPSLSEELEEALNELATKQDTESARVRRRMESTIKDLNTNLTTQREVEVAARAELEARVETAASRRHTEMMEAIAGLRGGPPAGAAA